MTALILPQTGYIYDVKICIICDMLARNRPHGISTRLDLNPKTVATVTDVIGHRRAHAARALGAVAVGHHSPALSSWLEQQTHGDGHCSLV